MGFQSPAVDPQPNQIRVPPGGFQGWAKFMKFKSDTHTAYF